MSVTTDTTALRVEHGTKRIRTYLGGELVADTTRPLLVWEKPYYPTYYFPAEDVRAELLSPAGDVKVTRAWEPGARSPSQQEEEWKRRPRHAWSTRRTRSYVTPSGSSGRRWMPRSRRTTSLHPPRNPYTRIDILSSSRHIRAELEGTTIAETTKPTLLFETGLVTRYYVPKTHVRMDLLVPSDSVSHCPYKGTAEYWSVRVGAELRSDAAWSYRAPLSESDRIAGLVAFFAEQVDVYVDDVLQSR